MREIDLKKMLSLLNLPDDSLNFLFLNSGEDLDGQLLVFKRKARKNYRNLSKDYHPDRPGGSLKLMQELNDAVDILSRIVIEPFSPVSTFRWRH